MQLIIDDQPQVFIPIKAFREQHNLPDDFGVAIFEPKSYEGLGSIDKAGTEMNALRDALLNAVPEQITPTDLMGFFYELQATFRNLMYGINETIGLQEVEVEFAVASFGDMNQNLHYAIMRGIVAKGDMPPFMQIYGDWLNSTVRVSFSPYQYDHNGTEWTIRTVNHVYGRVGLVIETGDTTYHVADSGLACPAEGFMAALLGEIAEKVIAAVKASQG